MQIDFNTLIVTIIGTVIGGTIVYFAAPAIRRLLSNLWRYSHVFWLFCFPSEAVSRLKGLRNRAKGIARQLDTTGKADKEALEGLAAELQLLRMHPPGILRLSGAKRLYKEIAFLRKVTKASHLLSAVDLLAAARRELNDWDSNLDIEEVASEEVRQAMLKSQDDPGDGPENDQ